MCDDFDVAEEFSSVLVNGGLRTLVRSPVSPPNAYSFTVPASTGPTGAGQSYGWFGGNPNYSSNDQLRISVRMKLDGSCANVAPDKEARILEFVMPGDGYRYVYTVRLVGLVPSIEIRHDGDAGAPLIARGQGALPTDTWMTLAEELRNETAAVVVDCVPQATSSRGGLPPSALRGLDIYMGLDAPHGWSNCTITFDDFMIVDL
jgi:hypothetical protein